jgi:serine/threonine-protein kinase HipA
MLEPGRWALSPAYDLNPVPEIERSQTPKTAISEDQEQPSIEAALNAAGRFRLRGADAKAILGEVLAAVKGWKTVARQLGIKAGTVEAYSTAFENPLVEEARSIM